MRCDRLKTLVLLSPLPARRLLDAAGGLAAVALQLLGEQGAGLGEDLQLLLAQHAEALVVLRLVAEGRPQAAHDADGALRGCAQCPLRFWNSEGSTRAASRVQGRRHNPGKFDSTNLTWDNPSREIWACDDIAVLPLGKGRPAHSVYGMRLSKFRRRAERRIINDIGTPGPNSSCFTRLSSSLNGVTISDLPDCHAWGRGLVTSSERDTLGPSGCAWSRGTSGAPRRRAGRAP